MSYGLYCGRLRQRLDRAWCALHWYVPLASRSPAFPWRSQEVYVAAAARRPVDWYFRIVRMRG